jgi:hypothetical protein
MSDKKSVVTIFLTILVVIWVVLLYVVQIAEPKGDPVIKHIIEGTIIICGWSTCLATLLYLRD